MPRIKPVDPRQVDDKTANTLSAVNKKLGMLPNMFPTFAHSPKALQGYLGLAETLSGGRLTAAQQERVAIAVAQENACEYCLSAHAALGRGAGLSDDDIADARRGTASDSMDALITTFALQIVRSRGGLSDQDIDAAREAGLDDGLIIEIAANVALNTLTNYVNKLAGTAVDFPLLSLQSAA